MITVSFGLVDGFDSSSDESYVVSRRIVMMQHFANIPLRGITKRELKEVI